MESHSRQILRIEERKKSLKAGLGITLRDPRRKVNLLHEVIWDRKIITEFTWYTSPTKIGKKKKFGSSFGKKKFDK